LKSASGTGFITRLSADGRTIVLSSYIGGSTSDGIISTAIDDQGNAYASGTSFSKDFPLVQPIQSSFGGSYDGVLIKVGPDGRLLFSTYWGGPGGETIPYIALRKDGMLFAVGTSMGEGFPLKDATFAQATPRFGWPNATLLAFDTKTNLVRLSTYLGDSLAAIPYGITLDGDGKIYVTGFVEDKRPALKNPLFSETVDGSSKGFLICLRPDGKETLWSTVLPAFDGYGVAVDSAGAVHVSGLAHAGVSLKNSFHEFKGGGILAGDHGIMKIAPGGNSLVYSTVIGGTGNEIGQGTRMAISSNGTVFFVGSTGSSDYPVRAAYQADYGGGYDGVFGRITDNTVIQPPPFQVSPPSLSVRYVQGDLPPAPLRVSVTSLTQAITVQAEVDWLRVLPATLAANGDVQIMADPSRLAAGIHRGAVRIGPVGVEVAVTVLAAAPLLAAVEPARVAIGTDDTEIMLRGSGFTNRTAVQLQTVPWGLTPVRFVDSTTLRLMLPKAYFSAETNHSITVQNPDSAVSKPVSLAVGRPAPSIAAKGIVSAASYAGDVVSPGEILTIFGENFEPGMRVNFDGLLATPLYVTPRQLSVVVPAGLAGAREVNVIVEKDFDWRSVPVRMVVWPARPGLFTANSSGRGLAAALNEDGTVNSAANPAAKGAIVVLWGTGGGVEPLPVKVFMDGMECEVLYAGGKDGLWQLNVRVPEFAVNGRVVWRAGERESGEGVSIALRD